MKISAPAAFALLASIGLAAPAPAASIAPTFNVVDLGSGYQLQSDSTGAITGVTGTGVGPSFAFDKSPTTSIGVQSTSMGTGDVLTGLGQSGSGSAWNYSDVHPGGYVQYTLQDGPLTQGYFTDNISGTAFSPHVPLGFSLDGTWHNELTTPVADMNAHGEIVGTSVIGNTSYPGVPTYAAFSTATGQAHDPSGSSSVADNLNTYIASGLGINLTQGLRVDDLGRIIAQGTLDGQTRDFLLIPTDLSTPPMPTPEPSTLALLAVGSLGWVARRRLRR